MVLISCSSVTSIKNFLVGSQPQDIDLEGFVLQPKNCRKHQAPRFKGSMRLSCFLARDYYLILLGPFVNNSPALFPPVKDEMSNRDRPSSHAANWEGQIRTQCLAGGVSDTDMALGPNLSGLPMARGATWDPLWREHILKDRRDKRKKHRLFRDLSFFKDV